MAAKATTENSKTIMRFMRNLLLALFGGGHFLSKGDEMSKYEPHPDTLIIPKYDG